MAKNPTVTQKQAVAIAAQYLKQTFSQNEAESFQLVEAGHASDGNWVLHFETNPDPNALGSRYCYITLNAADGHVLKADIGGGS